MPSERCHRKGHTAAIQIQHAFLQSNTEDLAGLQELFLRSSCPAAALQMRKDLQQWAEALALAQQLDPAAAGPLARRYAQVRCNIHLCVFEVPFEIAAVPHVCELRVRCPQFLVWDICAYLTATAGL